MANDRTTCHYCGNPNGQGDQELRPYGPGGAFVCFGCATATPSREQEATRQFSAALDASGEVAVLDGAVTGIRPFKGGMH